MITPWTSEETPKPVNIRLNACEREARKRICAKEWLCGKSVMKLARHYGRSVEQMQVWVNEGLADLKRREDAELA